MTKENSLVSPFRLSLLILLAIFIGGCQPGLPENQTRRVAPSAKSDLGLLIKGAEISDIAEVLKSYPNASARIISEPHKIFELYGLEKQTAKSLLPDVQIYKNEFSQLSPLESENSAPSITPASKCDSVRPVPAINTVQVNFPALDLQDKTIELGTTVSLTIIPEVHQKITDFSKVGWIVVPPRDSLQAPFQVVGPYLTVKPDTLGLHQVQLVLRSEHGNHCAVSVYGFSVTANPQLQIMPYNTLGLKDKLNMDAFSHLAEIGQPQALNYSNGAGVKIAIIDTGVNYNHPALTGSLAVNEQEIPENGIDDDHNGYIDDYIGVDFVNLDNYPYDDQGHGSHVAGIAASNLMGVAPGAKYIPIKALGPMGGDTGSVVAAIHYAIDRGAQIINMSLGGSTLHPLMIDAIQRAESLGILVTVAAGNGDPRTGKPMNIDQTPVYPAALKASNIITVAAKDSFNMLAPYSNYGVNSVHVTAPGGGVVQGDQIYSCTTYSPKGALFVGLQGTSMATPVVSGVAALMLSLNPSLGPDHIKGLLMNSGPFVNGLESFVRSGRYVNALDAVAKTALTIRY